MNNLAEQRLLSGVERQFFIWNIDFSMTIEQLYFFQPFVIQVMIFILKKQCNSQPQFDKI